MFGLKGQVRVVLLLLIFLSLTSCFDRGPIFVVDGKVGIGTSKPQSELAVKGKIAAQEVQVTLDGWADDVFAPGYDLRDLQEIEGFVRENGHLPDVPSQREVLEEGVAVGAMERVLLRKIEELTLYVIALDEKNRALETQVAELQRHAQKGRRP